MFGPIPPLKNEFLKIPRRRRESALYISGCKSNILLPPQAAGSNNPSMRKKTLLLIAACLESLLGTCFMIPVLAWFARLFLFSISPPYQGASLIVPAALSVGCFVLYYITIRKFRDLDSK
jgi:hypothetical protein